MPPTDACAKRWPIQLITGLRIAEIPRRQGEGGYVQRMEVIVKRKKSQGGGGGGGVRVDVNGKVKLLWKFKKKIFWWGGGVGLRGGQGGCELRSEAFVRIQKNEKEAISNAY